MQRYRKIGLLAAGALMLSGLAAGCGGSTTRATPLGTTTPTTVAAGSTSSPTTGKHVVSGGSPTTKPVGAPPNAQQLAQAEQELAQAGSSLAGSDRAINGSDVNQAKGQEGSAP